MIEGQGTSARTAIVELEIRGPGGNQMTIQAILDTGFDDYLTLTSDQINKLELEFDRCVEVRFGDGRTEIVNRYNARVMWDGEMKPIIVQESHGDHLLGMRLLGGCTLTMDITTGGQYTIDVGTCDLF